MHAGHTLVLAALLVASPASGQIPEKFENLQVFPRDVSRGDLVQRMREFSFALGVRCEHCHADAEPGVTNRYKSDVRPAKQQARAMIRMLATINGTLLPQLPSRTAPPVAVDCVICHRGLPLPRTLQTTLFETAKASGAAAAVARYRELRQADMGTGRYNFGEWEINELARRLGEAGDLDAALMFLDANGEFFPKSAEIDVMAGDVHRKRGETEKAVARYRAAVAKRPDHEGARRRLQELENKPR